MNKKMNLMLMLVLACSMSAMAQTNMSSDSSMHKDQMSGKKMSMTGCISEKDGKYMMMNKRHPDGVHLMSSEDLKPHVGHKMKVTGMMEKMDAMSGDSMNSADTMSKGDKMKQGKMGIMEMKVSSMKMLSDHCDMPKMMNQ
ncbi:MAG: hypothetical protein ACYDDI_09895 [Candidatus Acidiferrales bacterium]